MMTKKTREIFGNTVFEEQELVVLSDRMSVYNLKSQIFLKNILIAITQSYCMAILITLKKVYHI